MSLDDFLLRAALAGLGVAKQVHPRPEVQGSVRSAPGPRSAGAGVLPAGLQDAVAGLVRRQIGRHPSADPKFLA